MVRLGEVVPALELETGASGPFDLTPQTRPTLLLFHRHLGCLLCQDHVAAVHDRLDELGDTRVAVVTFADPSRLVAHRTRLGVPFPVLTDPTRRAYHAFGFTRGTRRAIWNPSTVGFYARAVRNRRPLARPTEDIRQLGGDIVIDATGRLTYRFASAHPDDRPSVEELIDAVHRSRRPLNGQ